MKGDRKIGCLVPNRCAFYISYLYTAYDFQRDMYSLCPFLLYVAVAVGVEELLEVVYL